MFEPKLQLIPEPDGEMSLLATMQVPNGRFSAGKVSLRAPEGIKFGSHARPVRLQLKYTSKGDLGTARTIAFRTGNLKLSDGDVLTVLATLPDGTVVGSSDAFVGADNAGTLQANHLKVEDAATPLTPQFCQNVVVSATGNASRFTGPEQLLRFLGVSDDARVTAHKIRIGRLIAQAGFSINLNLINSGPAVSVADCRDSVFDNASL